MDLNEILVFVEVLRAGSFTVAARALYMQRFLCGTRTGSRAADQGAGRGFPGIQNPM